MDALTEPKIVLPFVPEPQLTDDQRAELREALSTQRAWDEYLRALPCPDCEDGDCEVHP